MKDLDLQGVSRYIFNVVSTDLLWSLEDQVIRLEPGGTAHDFA